MARELKDSNFMEGDLLDFVDKMIEVFGKKKKCDASRDGQLEDYYIDMEN